jgi:hypothetical protein
MRGASEAEKDRVCVEPRCAEVDNTDEVGADGMEAEVKAGHAPSGVRIEGKEDGLRCEPEVRSIDSGEEARET